MKLKYQLLLLLTSVLLFGSCKDLYVTDPDTIINTKDYIAVEDEMYKGYLGILTKMQQAGDHAIFLTDTRGDFFETTQNTPTELEQIYNYENTTGNPYANPTCYYAIIIACNDYIHKMSEYRNKVGKSMDEKADLNFNRLISSTLRIKVWSYLTLGRIYGKAVWFDDPLEELKDLDNTKVFTWMNDMPAVVDKCLNLLDNGIVLYNDSIIPANLDMDWGGWIDSETNSTEYNHWKYITPNWLLLRCELLSWRGSKEDYAWMRDEILAYLFEAHNTISNFKYACNIPVTEYYYQIFWTERYQEFQAVTSIMYDYENNQTNRLVKYFCPTFPGEYYLRPSNYAMSKYGENDSRGFTQKINMNVIGGDTCFTKYYYYRGSYIRQNIIEIQPAIPIYRGHDFHFLLAEAENHLGNWEQAEAILNQGILNKFPNKLLPPTWNSNYSTWFSPSGGYGDVGIVGCVRGVDHKLPFPTDRNYNLSEEERIKTYDLALLDEALLEYCGEGKSYSMMVRMAEKYHDPSIVSNRVCPKYPAGKQAQIRSAIESGGYWVSWELSDKDNEINNTNP